MAPKKCCDLKILYTSIQVMPFPRIISYNHLLFILQDVPVGAVKGTDVAMREFEKMMTGDFDGIEENLQPMYDYMSEHVGKQRKRLGGNMAIAQAVFSRNQRDKIRKILGPDLVFIVLNMTKECQNKRVQKRHGDSLGDDFLQILYRYAELCEPAGEDEENAYNVTIMEGMSPEDVIQKILEIVNKL